MAAVETKPLVSILVAAYNAERWIRQCLDSALDQTYRATEILVVDDGSTDSTAAIAQKYADRVRLIPQAHAGGNAARNRLLELASGEWVQYLDSDDYLLPEKIANQMRRATEDPEPDVVYSPVLLRDETAGAQRLLSLADTADFTLHFIRWGALNTNGFLFRRQALVEVGGWNPEQAACQEHELVFRLISANKQFALVNTPGAVYRYHGALSVSRRDPLRTLRLKLELLDRMQNHLDARGGLTRVHKRELYSARMEAARTAWNIDPALAVVVSRQARSTGAWWVPSSSALPASFQFASRLLGYAGAERLAAALRGSNQAQCS